MTSKRHPKCKGETAVGGPCQQRTADRSGMCARHRWQEIPECPECGLTHGHKILCKTGNARARKFQIGLRKKKR